VNTTDQDGSIDAVADSLLMSEVNDQEAIQADDEDEQSVEAIDDGEATDDVEADDAIEADDEDHDEENDEVDEEPQESLHTVMVDGKPQNVTLEQLKQGFSGQAAIQKRLEDVANQRKQVETFVEQLKGEADFLSQTRQRLQAGIGATPPQPPSRELFKSDPIGFVEADMEYREKIAEYQQTQQMLNVVEQHRQAQMEAQHQALVQEELSALQQVIPELADPKRATAYRDKLVKGAVEHYGLTVEEVTSETSSRAIRVLNDAIKYREMLAKSQGAQTKMQNARPVIKAGVKHSETQATAKAKQKVAQRMKATGSVDDVAKFLLS